MENRHKNGVFEAIRMASVTHRLLTAGTVLCAAASVAASLVPPLLLARIIDGLTAGLPLTFPAVLLYFGSLALEGMLSSAQESLLVLFGQKMTHALRSEMSRKLTKLPASTLVGQNPGEVAARFSGDVDTVEALFTSGVLPAPGRRSAACTKAPQAFCALCLSAQLLFLLTGYVLFRRFQQRF